MSGPRSVWGTASWSLSPASRSISMARILAFGIGISRLPLATSIPDTCALKLFSGSTVWSRSLHHSPSSQSTADFSFKIAASFSGKGRKFQANRNVFDFNPDRPPEKRSDKDRRKKKKNRPDSGQDSYFISSVGSTKSIAFGIVSHLH